MEATSHRIRSNGKLLLSGEYMVLYGARALALPLTKGQTMEVEYSPGLAPAIEWTAADPDGVWFRATLVRNAGWSVFRTTDKAIAGRLVRLIGAARFLNPNFLSAEGAWTVHNRLEFGHNWGWGSSSTLIANMAKWAGVDALTLNGMVSEGSGYDIACARAESPIYYQIRSGRPVVQEIVFRPGFYEHIGFAYLGKKQDTAHEISRFDPEKVNIPELSEAISQISEQLAFVPTVRQFNSLIDHHEELIGNALNRSPVKKLLFPGFPGSIKSLGAWGGDFVLFCSEAPYKDSARFFRDRGFPVAFPWKEIIR